MCVGCRKRRKKEELIRLVRSLDGELVIDETREPYGRGYYLCPDRECLKVAQKKMGRLGSIASMDHGNPSNKKGLRG